MSLPLRTLVVCHCYREAGEVIRIISARRTSRVKRAEHARVGPMRHNYDFWKAKRNPYAKHLKRQVTIRLDQDTLEYFKALAPESRVPYQTLINLYLRCANNRKKLVYR